MTDTLDALTKLEADLRDVNIVAYGAGDAGGQILKAFPLLVAIAQLAREYFCFNLSISDPGQLGEIEASLLAALARLEES